MRFGLLLLFSAVLVSMIWFTTIASFDRSVFAFGAEAMPDPWFQATLADAYFGFLTFYVWVAYKETSWIRRGLWLVAIMLLGNIAMSVYMLIQLAFLPSNAGWKELLLRKEEANSNIV